MSLVFDHVAIEKASGFNLITADDWLRMPLREQYELITQSKAKFLKDGQPVRSLDAVKSMAARRGNGAAPGRSD
jgi:hypothetical protein